MASESGQPDAAVTRRLSGQPYDFVFFQAVRLLQRLGEGLQPVGRFAAPGKEAVRFGAHQSFGFPAAEIQSLEEQEDGPPRMMVNFLGMTGPLGVLPLVYTALVMERIRARDGVLKDFLDVFNHRFLSLFYRAWEKYRFGVPYERGEEDGLSRCLAALIGLGTKGLEDRQAVPDQALVFYGGLLGLQQRPVAALRHLLWDYFDVPVEIEPFAGAWRRLDQATQSSVGEGTPSERLGVGTVLGDEVWDQQAVVRIRLGPLGLTEYRSFLPGGSAYAPLRGLTRFFCGEDLDVEVQLVLLREEAPAVELGGEEGQLGWVSWMFTRPLDRDPDETVMRLWE